MKISPITFGKTVQIQAPFHEARRIANAVNYKKDDIQIVSPKVKDQVKEIFNDFESGHAIAYYTNDYNTCYIFSGKESREYQKNILERVRKTLDAKQSYQYNKKEALNKILEARRMFSEKTDELIKRSQEDYAIKIYPNGKKVEIVEAVEY